MAILGQITIDEIGIFSVSADPSVDGFVAPIGSLATLDDDVNGRLWIKSGAGNTAWSIVPRQADATALPANRFVFPDANGMLTTTPRALWDGTGRFSFGLNAPATPQSTIHLDRGTATGSHIRMTAGATTGVTSGDGTEFGIDDAGNAEILQRENSPINFYTNNTLRGAFAATGNFIVGATSTPIDITGASAFPQFYIVGTAAVQMAGIQYSADTIGPVFNLLKSRNAALGGHTVVQAGDEFGRIQFRASDGTNFVAGASIRALVESAPSTGSMPGYLIFLTTPTGSPTPVERMRIDSTGQAIFAANIRPGNGADTTNGNIRFDGTEFLAREGATWRTLTTTPTAITATANTSTTSATFSTITGMTATPAAGTYLVFFSGNVNTTGANTSGDVQLHIDAVAVGETLRNVGNTASFGTITVSASVAIQAVITVNGSNVVDVRFRENGGGTFNISNRGFYLIPIAR